MFVSGEEAGQFVVGEDTSIEVVDDGFECLCTADLRVDARHAVAPLCVALGDRANVSVVAIRLSPGSRQVKNFALR
jgi:hypothetical protein